MRLQALETVITIYDVILINNTQFKRGKFLIFRYDHPQNETGDTPPPPRSISKSLISACACRTKNARRWAARHDIITMYTSSFCAQFT